MSPPPRRHLTPRGAGGDLGNFTGRPAAERAARADALAAAHALQDRDQVPGGVWRHLTANAGDPDYTEILYERLGPAGTAGLVKAAGGDPARLAALRESLGTASHHVPMDAKWLRALLAEADLAGVRGETADILTGAELSGRSAAALARIGLAQPPARRG